MKNGNLRALLPRWRPILLFTLVEVALPWWLLSDAELRISSSLSGLLVASVPLLGALLSRLTGAHEPLGTRRLAGLGVGFAGVIALLAGVTLLGEPFTPGTAVGFVLIIAGSWLATGPSRSRRAVHAAAPDSPEQSRPVGSTG